MFVAPAARGWCIAVRNTKSAQRCICMCILTSRGYLDRKQLRFCFSGICGSWASGHVITDTGYIAAYMHARTHTHTTHASCSMQRWIGSWCTAANQAYTAFTVAQAPLLHLLLCPAASHMHAGPQYSTSFLLLCCKSLCRMQQLSPK